MRLRVKALKNVAAAVVFLLLLGVVGAYVYSAVSAHRRRRIEYLKVHRFPQIRVEVLNATGVDALAKRVARRLRASGFDVVFIGNSEERLPRTVAVERIDPDMGSAAALAGFIGCKEIIFEPDPDKLLEVTLVVGADYKRLFRGVDDDPVF